MDLTDALEDSFCNNCNEELSVPLICSPAKRYYMDNNCSMLSLATIAIGALDNNNQPFIVVNAASWNNIPKKSIKPSLDALRMEIK